MLLRLGSLVHYIIEDALSHVCTELNLRKLCLLVAFAVVVRRRRRFGRLTSALLVPQQQRRDLVLVVDADGVDGVDRVGVVRRRPRVPGVVVGGGGDGRLGDPDGKFAPRVS